MKVTEVITVDKFADNDVDYGFIDNQIAGSEKLADVSKTLSLWGKGNFFVLKKNQAEFVGFIKVTQRTIAEKLYDHVDLLFVAPQYRNTAAIKWLLYAVKETAQNPIIVDGVVFQGGAELIMSLIRHGASLVYALDKKTGEKTKITEPINDPNLCYLFEPHRYGFGQNYFTESTDTSSKGWVWYPQFEEF